MGKCGLVLLVFVALVLASALAETPAEAVARLTADLLDTAEPEPGQNLSKKQLEALPAFQKADAATQTAVLHKLADAVEKKGAHAGLSDEAVSRIADVTERVAQEIKAPSVRQAAARRWRDTLAKHPAEVSRADAARFLGVLKDPDSLDSLLESTLHDRRVQVRKAAAQALVALAEAEDYQGFANAVLLPRPHLGALEKMAETKGKFAERVRATVPLLIEEMQDTDESIELRWSATQLLGFTKSRDAVDALVERLEDTKHYISDKPTNQVSYNLRVQAIASLMEQGDRARRTLRKREHYEFLVRHLRRGGPSNDDATRQEIGRLLGWLREQRVLAVLLEVIDNEKGRYSDAVRMGAGAGLAELARNKDLSATLIDKLLPYVEKEASDVQAWALDALEFVREQLADKDQLALDQRIRTALRERGRKTDFRALVCRLVKNSHEWMDEKHWELPEHLDPDHPEESWQLAMRSLSLLFIAKAHPWCPEESRKILDAAYEDLLGKEGKLPKWAEVDRSKGSDEGNVPLNPNTIYAKIFYSLLLRELLAQGTKLTPEQKKTLEEAIAATEKSLRANLEVYTEGGESHPYPGSLMQTHAFSAALLSLSNPPRAATDGVAIMIRRYKNPATVAYYPVQMPEPERGAAIRSVTFQAATIQLARTPAERRAAVDRAVKALEAYTRHAWSYRVHATRSGTHSYASDEQPGHGIAPYYAWANYPYITGLIQALAEEKLTDAQRKIVAEAREETAAVLASLVQPGGLFTPPSAETYPSGKTWANALAGLAVIPLIGAGEGGKAVKPRLGILAPELFRAKGGQPAGAAGAEAPEKLEVAPRKCGLQEE
jgi:HEAT repeat protein